MKYDYTKELNNIVDNIYKEMILQIASNNENINLSKNNLKKSKELLLTQKVYLGSDMDKFIINCIPKGHEGNLFRISIAKHHNRVHPRFENYKGEPIVDSNYNKFSLLLWEDHMNNALIEDVQKLFTQEGFYDFINNKLDLFSDELYNLSTKYKNESVVINFENKRELLEIIADMIVDEKLSFDYAHMLVDFDKLRDDMTKISTTFDVYNEFDKLEDDTKYCIMNYCKYNSDELIDELINNQGFKLINKSLIK